MIHTETSGWDNDFAMTSLWGAESVLEVNNCVGMATTVIDNRLAENRQIEAHELRKEISEGIESIIN